MKHWNTDVERDSIEDVLTADFESDVQTLIVSFDDSKEIAGQKGYRLEFEYRQFENYVVVDENTARGTVDVYFPLQWPPRIFQGIEQIIGLYFTLSTSCNVIFRVSSLFYLLTLKPLKECRG